MKKAKILLLGVLGVAVMGGGLVMTAGAADNAPDRPTWVNAEGKGDLNLMPDTAKIVHQCWNGKTVTLDGKTIKKKNAAPAAPGSAGHKLGVEKVNELRQVGAVTKDSNGGEVINIDESNPKVQKIMEKYEAKEVPQCV